MGKPTSTTKTKIVVPGAAPVSMKSKRLPTYRRDELDLRIKRTASAITDVTKRKSAKIDLTRSGFISAHDSRKRLRKLLALKKTDMSDKKIKDRIDDTYRATWDAQDEFVRTSLIRDLVMLIAPGDLPTAEAALFESLLKTLSGFRFPTRYSGFNFSDGTTVGGFSIMQHPTSPGTGIWLTDLKGHSGAHNHLDSARIAAVLEGVQSLLVEDPTTKVWSPKPGLSLQELADNMIVTAGTFTFRNFTLSAKASNMSPDTGIAATDRLNQTKLREYLKDQLEAHGASRSTKIPPGVAALDLEAIDRPAAPDLLESGQISPRRGSIVSFKDIEPLLKL